MSTWPRLTAFLDQVASSYTGAGTSSTPRPPTRSYRRLSANSATAASPSMYRLGGSPLQSTTHFQPHHTSDSDDNYADDADDEKPHRPRGFGEKQQQHVFDGDDEDEDEGEDPTMTTILIDRGFTIRRPKGSLGRTSQRWYRTARGCTRFFPRPITVLFVLTLGTLILVLVMIRDQWTTLIEEHFPVKAWYRPSSTSPAFEASFSTSGLVKQQHMSLPRRPIPIQSHLEFLKDDAAALEAWVARGEILPTLNFENHTKIDGLWYWVNGSDPRHHVARDFFSKDPTRAVVPPYVAKSPLIQRDEPHALSKRVLKMPSTKPPTLEQQLQNTDNRFREHDELRYSLRSARASLGDFLRTSHVVSTDFWPSGLPEEDHAGVQDGSSATAATTTANAITADTVLDDADTISDLALGSQGSSGSDPAILKSRWLGKRLPAPGISTVTVGESAASVAGIDVGQSDVFHVEGGLVRYGQLPQWLNVNAPGVRVGDRARLVEAGPAPLLRMHHDWSIFMHQRDIDPAAQILPEEPSEQEMLEWKLRVLPTFNSMAAEASLGMGVTDLSDAFFYSNDDNFLGHDLSTSDFSSPLYGPVLHINRNYPLAPVERPNKELGEHPSLKYSIWLLGERFGHKTRHYIIHVQKTHLRPLILESRMMFGSEFANTAAKRFRGDGRAANSHMLSYNFVVERHREALLWSYFVARLDIDGDGMYSDEELKAAWADLGLPTDEPIWKSKPTRVLLPQRDTLLKANVRSTLEDAHFPAPRASTYQWSSQDGYSLSQIAFPRIGGVQWPTYHQEPGTAAHDPDKVAAWINWATCWNAQVGRDPIELFKHMAFESPDCGDFLIPLLVGLSGRKGLSAFLPHEDTFFPDVSTPVHRGDTVPHLPLNHRWNDVDYTLRAVARNTGWSAGSRRHFAMAMIQRYSYSIAGAPTTFEMLTSPSSAKASFEKLRKNRKVYHGTAFIGINDDVKLESQEAKTFKLFSEWMEEEWPTAEHGLPYEKR